MLPDIDSVEVKTEPLESVTVTIASNPPVAASVSTPVVVQQHVLSQQKSLVAAPSLVTAKKSVPPIKPTEIDSGKSILGKSNRQKAATAKAAKTVKAMKDPALSAVRRIVDTPVTTGNAVRRIPDNPVPPVVRRASEAARGKKEMSLLDPVSITFSFLFIYFILLM